VAVDNFPQQEINGNYEISQCGLGKCLTAARSILFLQRESKPARRPGNNPEGFSLLRQIEDNKPCSMQTPIGLFAHIPK
jgi:hypothetical protein